MAVCFPRFFSTAALALCFILLWTGTSAGQAVPPPRYVMPDESPAPGTLPRDVIPGDFDGDGVMDVAVANDGPAGVFDGGVAVLFGDGTGRLGEPVLTPLPAGQGASELAAADFNEDGNLDVVAVASSTGGFGPIHVLFGNGLGSFTFGPQFPNGDEVHLASADFDLDGNADFAQSSNEVADIDIRFGDGAGNFPRTRDLNPPFDTYDFATADMEGDGDPDLFGASGGTPFSMLNNGDGTFAAARTSTGIFGIDLTLDHFDGDGLLDIAVGNASDMSVFTGNGNPDGTFTWTATYRDLALQVDSVASGDVTGDGRVDLLANSDTHTSNLLRGRGDGTFARPVRFVTGEQSLITARMNGDARADLVALVQDPGQVYVSLGAGNRGFRAPRVTDSPTQGELGHFEADYDEDGRLDLMLLGSILPEPGVSIEVAEVFLNRGGGSFRPPVATELDRGPDNTSVGAFSVGDVNGDGLEDIVGVFVQITPFRKNLVVYLGEGDGSFAPPFTASPQVGNDDALHPVKLADVTEDGLVDVVTRTLAEISVLPGNGDGTFAAPIHSGFSQAGHTDTLIADYTGDGHLDLVIPIVTGNNNISSSDVYLEQGLGDGTFFQLQKQTIDTNISSGVAAQLNADGAPDAALIGQGGTNVGRTGLWVFLNAGGLLGPGVYYARGQTGLDAGDVNLDGAVDLVTSCLLLNLNDGAGNFDQFIDLLCPSGVTVVADFTQDGRPDIVSPAGFIRQGFALYINIT